MSGPELDKAIINPERTEADADFLIKHSDALIAEEDNFRSWYENSGIRECLIKRGYLD